MFDLAQTLRDGVLLCQLLNNLRAHSINLKEINLRPQMSQVKTKKNSGRSPFLDPSLGLNSSAPANFFCANANILGAATAGVLPQPSSASGGTPFTPFFALLFFLS